MEEIRTSEKLEQEIIEDAQKKAERILKGTEKTLSEIEQEWEKKEKEFIALSEQELAARKQKLEQELNSSLPLELKRLELEEKNRKVEKFLADFFENLSEEDFLKLLRQRIEGVKEYFIKQPIHVQYQGLSNVAELIRSVLPENPRVSLEEGKGSRGVILETEDGKLRYRITVEELGEEVRENYRKELFNALFRE
jgi:vacuolar-type H+-ATPase subunit E/Vma4